MTEEGSFSSLNAILITVYDLSYIQLSRCIDLKSCFGRRLVLCLKNSKPPIGGAKILEP